MGNSGSLPRCVHALLDAPQRGAIGGESRANDSEHPTPQRRASGGPPGTISGPSRFRQGGAASPVQVEPGTLDGPARRDGEGPRKGYFGAGSQATPGPPWGKRGP